MTGINDTDISNKRPGRGWLIAVVIALAALVAGIIIIDRYGDRLFMPFIEKKIKLSADVREMNIYFVGVDGESLQAEKRIIKKAALEDEIKETLSVLINGPQGRDLSNAIPEGVRLLGVKLQGPSATIDFSPEMINNHPGGSTYELLTVYSIVDTLTMNFPEVKEVQILVGGKKAETIAGHIDATVPFAPDMTLIKK